MKVKTVLLRDYAVITAPERTMQLDDQFQIELLDTGWVRFRMNKPGCPWRRLPPEMIRSIEESEEVISVEPVLSAEQQWPSEPTVPGIPRPRKAQPRKPV
jgi:hypothetical protein